MGDQPLPADRRVVRWTERDNFKGGCIDISPQMLVGTRGLIHLTPHPKQMRLEGFQVTPDRGAVAITALRTPHECSCVRCHPERYPQGPAVSGLVSASFPLEWRFWDVTLDGQRCAWVKEAMPGPDGYVWCCLVPPHNCPCVGDKYCTTVLHGAVTVAQSPLFADEDMFADYGARALRDP